MLAILLQLRLLFGLGHPVFEGVDIIDAVVGGQVLDNCLGVDDLSFKGLGSRCRSRSDFGGRGSCDGRPTGLDVAAWPEFHGFDLLHVTLFFGLDDARLQDHPLTTGV